MNTCFSTILEVIEVMECVAKEYPGRTIENIIVNLKSRLTYADDIADVNG